MTILIIMSNMKKWLQGEHSIETTTYVPDASKTLKNAAKIQQDIGWDQWMKGRWTMEWAYLIYYDVKHSDSNIKNNSAEKIGK
jgi:hypothetical protein